MSVQEPIERMDAAKGLSLEDAIAQLQRIQTLHASRPWRLVVRKTNPGGLSCHQTTEVRSIHAGFDWEAGRVVIEPVMPLTELTTDQVDAIRQSVRAGASWHAGQRERKMRDRIAELEAENARLRANRAR